VRRRLTRRAALRLLAAAGLAPLAAGAGGLAGCRDARRPGGPDPAQLITHPADMARVGELWLEAQNAAPDVAALVDALSARGDRDEDALRRRLADRQREDWIEGRVEEVRGFRFARTELELYALAALLGRAGGAEASDQS
jgi:hypothetical protein